MRKLIYFTVVVIVFVIVSAKRCVKKPLSELTRETAAAKAKVKRLEAEVIGLKRTVHNHELQVVQLKKEIQIARNKDQSTETNATILKSRSILTSPGHVAVNKMPKSCTDLWQIGHTLSGFYSVLGAEMVESVFCDFSSKLPSDPGYQTYIGYVDVKSLPVYFYVQKNDMNIATQKTPIPFEVERLNIGKAMNLTSGIFTAPRAGTYFFSFTGIASFPATPTTLTLRLGLYLNGHELGNGYADHGHNIGLYKSFSFQSTLKLQAEDKVWLAISYSSARVELHDNKAFHYSHFTGQLIEENISKSFNLTIKAAN